MKRKPYPKYKDSGIKWIREIPEGWEARRIKMLSYVRRGASPRPIDDLKYFDDDGEYSWVRIADVTASDKYLLNTTEKLSKIGKSFSVPLEPGEIFISIAATVGKPVITKIKCCIHDGFVYFQRLKIDPDYLYYVFVGDEVYKGLGKLGTQLNLNTETIGEIFIPTPLKSEQTTIANFLDKKTAKINSLIEKDEKLIVLLKEKRTALINHAVTKGLDPNAKMNDSGIEWIGEIPDKWSVRKIDKLSTVSRGASPRPIDDPKYFDDGEEYSWVRIADVTASGRYLLETTEKLSTLGKSLSVPLEPGRLFISIAGTVGKPIITKIKCCIHDGFVYFKNLKVLNEYLYYIFIGGQAYLGLGKLGTQLNLNTETIGLITIPLPPKEEQQKIVEYLDKANSKMDKTIQKIEKKIELLEEYKKSLIHYVVTGKVDVRKSEV